MGDLWPYLIALAVVWGCCGYAVLDARRHERRLLDPHAAPHGDVPHMGGK